MIDLKEVIEYGNQISQEVKKMTIEEQKEILQLIDMYKFCKSNLLRGDAS